MPSPLRVTIDCSDEKPSSRPWISRSRLSKQIEHRSDFDVKSFCSLIHRALPHAVQNGRFVMIEPDHDLDQTGLGDTLTPVSIAPPKEFATRMSILRFKQPRLKIPKIDVPILNPRDTSLSAPRLAPTGYLPAAWYHDEEESSVEKMEIFKKGIQKMLHFVKVLGKVDQYLSERTRFIIEKLSKTFID